WIWLPKLLQIPSKSAVRFSSSYKKSSNHQVIRTPIFCSPTTVDEEPDYQSSNQFLIQGLIH
ncbi:hypothetical protein, partial [Lentilactobacillus parabuchneri]|uniref:hypothetical protein n=1 Tax=Lentilactobacillus parabuchneri TaxID=152331 RepID=UPI00195CE321